MPARANVAETSSAASGEPGPPDAGSCPEELDRVGPHRQAEVGHLGLAVRGQEDIARLEVEVEHARVAGVGVMDRPGDPSP